MKKNLTELVFILDMSGSMHSLRSDTIGGFNSMLESQRNNKDGDALVTTVLFNERNMVMHDRIAIKDVPLMTEQDFAPRGCTALLDAVGKTISHISNIHRYAREEDVPENTLIVITTDGLENASREYTAEKVKSMISAQQEKGWEFIFLGANIDSVSTARDIGIDVQNAVDYRPTAAGTNRMYCAVDTAVRRKRRSERVTGAEEWRRPIEEEK